MSNKKSISVYIMNKKYFFALLISLLQFSVKAQYRPDTLLRPTMLSESIVYEDDDTNKLGVFSRYFFDAVTETGNVLHGKRTGDWYFFDVKGSLMFRGHYKDGLKTGMWEYYNNEGVKRCEIFYKAGYADSTWTGYSLYKLPIYKAKYKYGGIIDTLFTYHESGINYLTMVYRNGSPYSVVSQFDVYGHPLESGNFKFGTGVLQKYYPYGQLFSTEDYSGGSLNGEAKYLNIDGIKKAYGIILDNEKKETWTYLNYDGTEVPFATYGKPNAPFDLNMSYDSTNKSIYTPAQYPGGNKLIKDFLLMNLIYPESARKIKIEGTVWLNFEVDEIGHIRDVKIYTRIGEGCDEEAEFLIKNMPNWRPAMQMGIPVKSRVYLPVEFKLE